MSDKPSIHSIIFKYLLDSNDDISFILKSYLYTYKYGNMIFFFYFISIWILFRNSYNKKVDKIIRNQSKYTLLNEITLERDHNVNGNTRLTLINTYWITEKKIKHRDEIEMAMLSNLHNKYISEVVVLLDNSVARDCSTLDRTLKARGIKLNKKRRAKFTCVPNQRRQSGYYDLFNYSTRVDDSIVILSNADQVFDDSIDIARRLPPGLLITLATRGFSSHVSENLKGYYPKEYPFKIVKDRCYRPRCYRPRKSWDSYIFRPQEISDAIQPEYFRVIGWRKGMNENNETLFMNVPGAENKALGIIKKYAPNIKMFQGCDFIRSWHFHQYKKTHYKKSWPKLKTGSYRAPDMTNKTFRSVFYPVHSEQESIPVN